MDSEESRAAGGDVPGTEGDFTAAAGAVREHAGDDGAWDRLEALAADGQTPDPVAALYREVLGRTHPAELGAHLARRAVAFHEEWYREDSPHLVAVLERVLVVDPEASEWAFPRLSVVYTVGERWEELLALYDREIDAATDRGRRSTLLEEAAQTAKDFADAPDRAIGYLQQLLALRPEDDALAASLERLLERQERRDELATLWRDRLARLGPPEARALRHRLAETLLALARPEEALAELRTLLDDAGLESEDAALGLLDRIARDEAASPDVRRQALDLLRQRYTAADRTSLALGTLDAALALADEGEKVALHRQAAGRLLDAGPEHAGEALEHLGSALRLAPEDRTLEARLRQVAEAADLERRGIDLLAAAADASKDASRRALLRRDVAARLEAAGARQAAIPQLTRVRDAEGLAPAAARGGARELA
ncbi:MAG: hypothetical protein AAGH15_27290, partial [Myxococcota bacterium]